MESKDKSIIKMTECSRVEKYWSNKASNKNEITCIISILIIMGASIIAIPVFGQTSGPSNPNANVTTAYKLLSSNSTNTALNIKTDLPSYTQGDTIVITGHASQPNSNSLVTLRIINSNQNLVSVTQVLPDSNGDFIKTILATGPLWKDAGTFTILAQYGVGSQPVNTTFYYNGGTGTTTITPAITPNPTSSLSPANSTIIPSTPSKIPHWVKTVFNLYGQGQVSDDDLISALRFLIQSGVIRVS